MKLTRAIINKSIEQEKSKILSMNKVYREYLSSGENVSLEKYETLMLEINKFKQNKSEDGLASYSDLKASKKWGAKRAFKRLSKELSSIGVNVSDMTSFRDMFAEELKLKVENFSKEVKSYLKDFGDNEGFSLWKENALSVFVNDLKKMKLSELKILEMPDPKKYAEEIKKTLQEAKANDKERCVNQLKELNKIYLDYKNKGNAISLEDAKTFSDKMFDLRNSLKFGRASIALAKEDLKEDEFEIISALDSNGFLSIEQNYQKAKEVISKAKSEAQDIIEEHYSYHDKNLEKHLLESLSEYVGELENLTLDVLLEGRFLKPNSFLSLKVHDYQEKESERLKEEEEKKAKEEKENEDSKEDDELDDYEEYEDDEEYEDEKS